VTVEQNVGDEGFLQLLAAVLQGYYDMSGGRVTFHSKLTVPVPRGAARTAAAAAGITQPQLVTDPVPNTAVEAAAARQPTGPVSLEKGYLDPDGVDVYGVSCVAEC